MLVTLLSTFCGAKTRVVRLLILSAACLFVFSSHAADLSLKTNSNLKKAFIETIRTAILDDISVTENLELQFPGVNRQSQVDGLFYFESSILDIFQSNWKQESLDVLGRDWGFTSDEAFDISIYYGARIFSAVADSENPHLLFQRIKEISQRRFISENQKLYEDLRSRLTIQSVPEIAAELGMAELHVYRQLYNFGLSITPTFDRPVTADEAKMLAEISLAELNMHAPTEGSALNRLRALELAGAHFEQVARIAKSVFGFGQEAVRFIFHSQNVLNRGVEWDRATMFEGTILTESEILVRFFEQGLSHREIAERLNSLFKPRDENDFRTENSVFQQLSRMGFRRYQSTRYQDVFHGNYGFLYKNGRFVVPMMIKYLIDHQEQSITKISDRLGIPLQTLQAFAQRNELNLLLEGKPKLQRTLSRYKMQQLALMKTLHWVQKNNRTPGPSELPAITGIYAAALFPYVRRLAHLAIFEDTSDFYLQLRDYGVTHGTRVSVVGIVLRSATPEFTQARQEDALEKIFEYFQANDGKLDWSTAPSSFTKLIRSDRNLFPSAQQDLWLRYKAYSESRGVPFLILHAPFWGQVDESLREILQQEVLELVRNWMDTHEGRFPAQIDYTKDLGVNMNRVCGKGNYGPGTPRHPRRIFDSTYHFYSALKEYLREHGKTIWIISIKVGHQTEEMRQLLRSEAVDLIIEWIKRNGDRFPTRWLFEKDPLPQVGWDRLTGQTYYADGNPGQKIRIFDSEEDLKSEVNKRLADPSCKGLL